MYLTWKTDVDKEFYAIDIETNGLKPDTIWCMCWENIRTKETGECIGHEAIRQFFKERPRAVFIGHNSVSFDIAVINRLLGCAIGMSRLIDTMIMSTVYLPSIPDGHGLEAWGVRMGYPKIKFNDWSKLSPEMVTYCHQDVKITAELFRRMVDVLIKIGVSEQSLYIQHYITPVINRQKQNGFEFDIMQARGLYSTLRKIENDYKDKIHVAFPPVRTFVRRAKTVTKAGNPTAIYTRDQERYETVLVGGSEYEAYDHVEFNIGSPTQRTEKLVELGWENWPDEVTKTGKPKPFEKGKLAPSLEAMLEEMPSEEIRLIAKWMTVNGRANMVNTWIEAYNEDTGKIHGNLFVADTLRFKHSAPNTANIPAVRSKKDESGKEFILYKDAGDYTYEARDCWKARKGRVLVGTDAAGLELRMLAHYLNRPDFTKQVVEGDPHQYNADLAEVERPTAKTLLYAIQYGAQAGKVAKIIKRTLAEGKEMRQRFLDRLGLTEIMEIAQHEQQTGRVSLVDGSQLVCPSPHAALNYKLQGGGARVMALGAIILERDIRRYGLDSLKVGDIHDEWQYDVAPDDAREHARLSILAIREAGRELNLNVPLDANAKEGLTWAQTH